VPSSRAACRGAYHVDLDITTYRQMAHRLRIQRGPGRPDRVSERPRKGNRSFGWGEYADSDEQPTLITFDEHDRVDVPALLAIGAIVPWQEVTSGEIFER